MLGPELEKDANGGGERVLIVDDHDLFRTGLLHLLQEHGVRVVGAAPTGEDGLRLVAERKPDVVLMDINMPGMGGVEATRRIRSECAHAQVLVLTISADEQDVLDALTAGACGYLLKDAPVDQLLSGIKAAGAGEALVSPSVAAQLVRHVRATSETGSEGNDVLALLSERELQILRLMVQGKNNDEIAGALFLSSKTVKNQITALLRKLKLDNRVEAAVFAVRSGVA